MRAFDQCGPEWQHRALPDMPPISVLEGACA